LVFNLKTANALGLEKAGDPRGRYRRVRTV
jgi:hypothetical protein